MKKGVLTDYEAEKFLAKYIKVSKNQLVQRPEEIKIKTPLALKIISKDALHKSDIGGVKIVKSQEEVEPAFSELLKIAKRKKLKLDGIMAQKFEKGTQLIIGIKKDPVFDHAILFGLGGIFTEVLKDTAVRKCPISKIDAEEMLSELKAAKIFEEFRGKKLNTRQLINDLIKISEIPKKHKNLRELDINPYMLDEKKGVAVDARAVFE